MIKVRRASERGHFNHGWLDTYHTFSFGEYSDPKHMGFRALSVINEDRVQPGAGFPTHHHSNMEIVTLVLEGSLSHKDSLDNGSTIHAGDVQRMSAGTGLTHSEFNTSDEDVVHFLQMWILPASDGLPPGYEQQAIPRQRTRGRLFLVASPDGRENSLTVHQDVTLWTARLDAGQHLAHPLADGRHVWLQVVQGSMTVNDVPLEVSDGAAVSGESSLTLQGKTATEFLLFDLS